MPKPLVQSTGRRKQAIARVRLRTRGGATARSPSTAGRSRTTSRRRPTAWSSPSRCGSPRPPRSTTSTPRIHGGGPTGQAGALRLGIARALIELDPELRAALKKAGFLTRDAREKESKKYGLKKARKAPQYQQALAAFEDCGPDMLKFGTDGVRGVANAELTPELVLALGRAAARVVPVHAVRHRARHAAVGARARGGAGRRADQRGRRCHDGSGSLPTPAVACVRPARDGVLASDALGVAQPVRGQRHQAVRAGGRKLTDAQEQALEAELGSIARRTCDRRARPCGSGRRAPWSDDHDGVDRLDGVRGRRPSAGAASTGCAWSSTVPTARPPTWRPKVLRALGAQVEVLHADPDGTNINAGCGSTYPQDLQRAVVADRRRRRPRLRRRCRPGRSPSTPRGRLVDGDQIIAIAAIDLQRARACSPATPSSSPS